MAEVWFDQLRPNLFRFVQLRDSTTSCLHHNWIFRPIYAVNDRLYTHEFPIPPRVSIDRPCAAKILLLGCGDVGKSTIFKQVIMIYENELTDTREFRTKFKDNIRESVWSNIRGLPHFGDMVSSLSEPVQMAAANLHRLDRKLVRKKRLGTCPIV